MKSTSPCIKFQPSPDSPVDCFWCGWSEPEHRTPRTEIFEATYWETVFNSPDLNN